MFYNTYIKKGSTDIKDVRRAVQINTGVHMGGRLFDPIMELLKAQKTEPDMSDFAIEGHNFTNPALASYLFLSEKDFNESYEPFDASGCLGCGPVSENLLTNKT